jgi:dolichol-phosphate mannosyltransferase
VKDWPLKRKLISKGATLLARPITSVRDPMSGFFAIRRSVIEGLELKPKSCKICLDIVARGDYENLVEVPFIFPERQAGESKLSNRIMRDYVSHLFALLFAKNSTFKRFFKFCVVGALGTLVNLAVLYTSVEGLGLWYIHGAVLAYFIALIHNFTLNKLWTFGDRRSEAKVVLGSLGKYFLITTGGLAINLTVLFILTDLFNLWYIHSQVLAIMCEVLWNFSRSRVWAFEESR